MQSNKKTLEKNLSTGQKIEISQQEEKSLRASYDYLKGFAERQRIVNQIAEKKASLVGLEADVANMPKEMRETLSAGISFTAPPSSGESGVDTRTPDEVKVDSILHTRDEIALLESSLENFNASDSQISVRDIDAMLKHFNANMKKAELEFMIWEVNDTGSGKIGWDEYQLVYYRKVIQNQCHEPEAFFQILEYLLYDMNHNGYILEDDCMEVLYGRHGLSKLQEEMNFLFGNNLRAAGGNGQLCCQDYLNVVATRDGRRAVVDGGNTKY